MDLLSPKLRWAWALAGAAGLVLVLAGTGRLRRKTGPAPIHGPWETDPVLWGRDHPRQYGTWRQGRERDPVRPQAPLEPGLFAGCGAGADGMEPAAQGHPAACMACHDPATLELRVTQPVFLQALKRQGLDPARLGRAELRTYVCAQCHSIRTRGLAAHPPDIAFSLADLRRWAQSAEPVEWRHAVSGTPLTRIRHAEYAFWREGIHAQRDVSCPDCHMPQVSEGTTRFTDHSLGDPLAQLQAACMGCHHGGEAPLRDRVKATQATMRDLQARTAQALRKAHESLGKASGPEAETARAMVRQAQFRWEAVASDGSGGFHAPQETARLLGEALDLARQADLEARKRTKP